MNNNNSQPAHRMAQQQSDTGLGQTGNTEQHQQAPTKQRAVTDVVPNDAAPTTGAGGRPDAFEIVQQQQALLQAQQQQLREALTEIASFKERENLKRKRDEEDAAKQEAAQFVENKSKTVAALRAMLEEVSANSRGGLAQEHIDGIGKETLQKLDGAKNRIELEQVAAAAAPFMKFVHAASMDGKRQREEAEALQLRQTQAALRQMAVELPHTGVQVSGGVHQQQQMFGAPASTSSSSTAAAALETADSGSVQASLSRGGGNIFTSGTRNATVSDVLRGGGGSAPTSSAQTVAAPAISLEDPEWVSKVEDECIAMHGMLPGEKYLRYGGEEIKTRFNASANRHEVVSRKPRRERPLQGVIHMGIRDPKGMKQIIDGINACKRGGTASVLLAVGARNTKELAEVKRWGEFENGKPKYFEPYRGPLPSDNLMG